MTPSPLKGCPHGRTQGYFASYVRVRPQRRTRTKVRVRRPPTVLDLLYVLHFYDVQMYELAVFRWAYYHRWRFKSNGVFTRYTL